jgi:hypothetical protein
MSSLPTVFSSSKASCLQNSINQKHAHIFGESCQYLVKNIFTTKRTISNVQHSVVNPDPDVFGPSGSGYVIIFMDPDPDLDTDSSIIKQK